MKFEEAFSDFDHITYSIDEIEKMYKYDKVRYANNYHDHFLCPECHKAKLSYNDAETPYFKSYPHAKHAEDCSLRQSEMSAIKAEKLVNDESSREEIQRQMERVLAMLLSNTSSTRSIGGTSETGHSTSQTLSFPINSLSKRFPKKRIDLAFRPEDFNCYKLYYGCVLVRWEQDKKNDKYRVLLYHAKQKHLVCRISVTNAVYQYIDMKFKFSGTRECNVVFLAIFTRDTGKNYQSTYLRFGDKIIMQER